MSNLELSSRYTPSLVEPRVTEKWLAARAFHADPPGEGGDGRPPFCIVIPPPNVTAALHLGHALNNTLQDVLVRWHRMRGFNTLWMPGTDHAGIATQTVVEKRVLAEEGRRRTDFRREEFVAKIQAWKDEYEQVILGQLRAMGCSCDWDRTRFTMDPQCARAVREAFFRLFKDGLIYRGKRLVNWDPVTQTALADDEVENEEIDGHFYYLKYPLDDGSGHVTVATTRPETMLGDTAVAVNPRDPRAPGLRGRFVKLPLVGRVIPIIEDEHVVLPDPDSDDPKAKMASGFLKVTPAHDPNDWEIGQRHRLPIINVFSPMATISREHGWPSEEWNSGQCADAEFLLGMDRYEARQAIVEWFRAENLLEDVRPYRHTVGHSYRSHVPIEPYLSDQWYVKVTDDRLSGAALRALREAPAASPGSGDRAGPLRFIPERYVQTYRTWNENIRDWCISRQLWWGHRIPVWSRHYPSHEAYAGIGRRAEAYAGQDELSDRLSSLQQVHDRVCVRFVADEDSSRSFLTAAPSTGGFTVYVCVLEDADASEGPGVGVHEHDVIRLMENLGFVQDPDVLDTWFSSGLWPLSTMGWPDDTPELRTWNPSSVLCTAREIITLWVSRMVMFNLYFRGCLPFTDVFIHAMIQDGEGRKMSKSLGNGVDPMDIIHTHGADAMRFTLTQMTTQTQDVRLPVERDPATGRNTSPRFDGGRNFANKLWNAVRFSLTYLAQDEGRAAAVSQAMPDRWILSRRARAIAAIDAALRDYDFHNYANRLYQFVWNDFCDWYLEAIKPTVRDDPAQQVVLRQVLETILKLAHPVMPFITEALWEALPGSEGLLATSAWPVADDAAIDDQVEDQFERLQTVVTMIREVRTQTQTPPRETVQVSVKLDAALANRLQADALLIERLANVRVTDLGPGVVKPEHAAVVVRPLGEVYLHRKLDVAAERQRLAKQIAATNRSLAALEARLNNKGYTDKAPAHLVQQTRDELTAKQRELAALEKQLASLGD